MKQEFHLTPRGWVKGAFYPDSHSPRFTVKAPPDRVLSIECRDEDEPQYGSSHVIYRVIWEDDNREIIQDLKNQFGERPDCLDCDTLS